MTLDESIVTRALRDRREAIERAERAEAALATGLDVEKLARALDSGIALGQPWTSETVSYRTFLIQCAAVIAREYAALALCQHMIPAAECRVVGCQP